MGARSCQAFRLIVLGHGECARFFRAYNVPLMLLGGGGYTPVNVARCWAYETAIALGKEDELSEGKRDLESCRQRFGAEFSSVS